MSTNFNPRLPGGRRRLRLRHKSAQQHFNPRLPGGRRPRARRRRYNHFNPRLPGGRRRTASTMPARDFNFNPRLPGGRRPRARLYDCIPQNFNPRLPGGRRQSAEVRNSRRGKFQSTPPGWEATFLRISSVHHFAISIHASRVGGDSASASIRRALLNFNPRLPGGRRQYSI